MAASSTSPSVGRRGTSSRLCSGPAAAHDLSMRIFGRANARQQVEPEQPDELETATPERAPVELEVIAYAEDCVLTGRLQVAGDRMSDYLNTTTDFEMVDVSAQDLVGNDPIEAADIAVERDEILLVQATGSRGNPSRRTNTRQHAIVVRTGPYEISGLIHSLPGIDPIEHLRRRRPMFAMTNATIQYTIASVPQTVWVEAVIVNRECVDSIVEAYPEAAPDTTVVAIGNAEQLSLLA